MLADHVENIDRKEEIIEGLFSKMKNVINYIPQSEFVLIPETFLHTRQAYLSVFDI